jgi:predicted Fe-S protein YdhL (DUF1289 family)
MDQIKSPCKLICKYDKNKYCIGCYRSMSEIINWKAMSNEAKKEVLENTIKRKNDPNFIFKMTDED